MIISFDLDRERLSNMRRNRHKNKLAIRRVLYMLDPVKIFGTVWVNDMISDKYFRDLLMID